jgi:predicted ATPase
MKYSRSGTDERNFSWFRNDPSRASLHRIELTQGRIRGLDPCKIEFEYPISAFAGRNGSGKSTILAIAACAYHSRAEAFKLPHRRTPYYTFSDFFVQSSEDVYPEGIEIRYSMYYNRWKKTAAMPDGVGVGWQRRWKGNGGKWNDYASRLNRTVIHFGIDRVVPHNERSAYISSRGKFTMAKAAGWEDQVREIASRILGRNYTSIEYKSYLKYRLPIVGVNDHVYSGFNMGAGENAVFELLTAIFSCGESMFITVDEIELGLHEEAQARFINELKELCSQRKIQVICTTHSSVVMKCLPPEARFYVESLTRSTIVTKAISHRYAAGKMAGENSSEIDLFVEDDIARTLVGLSLTNAVRSRSNVLPIGSDSAIVRQMAARFRNLKEGECYSIFDGDKEALHSTLRSNFLKLLETITDKKTAESWFDDRVSYLPGGTTPEKWLIEVGFDKAGEKIADALSVDEATMEQIASIGKNAAAHREFYEIGRLLNVDSNAVVQVFTSAVKQEIRSTLEPIEVRVLQLIDN